MFLHNKLKLLSQSLFSQSLELVWQAKGEVEDMLTCVWMSSPVTMFPTALRAGEATL